MAYTIRNTRGDTLKTIADGTLDSTLPIKLYGKNYLGYGEGLQNNLIAILENFTKDTEPSAPLKGQLWYDNANLDLKVYNGTAFVQAIKTVSNLAAGNISVTSNITVANINFTTAMTGPQLVSNIATGTAPISVNSTTQVPNLNVAVAGNLINGNSNVIVNANSYVTISVGGTANVVNVATDSMTITGNITANIANLTTINSGLLQNGNSNVTITANSDVTIASNGSARITVAANGSTGFGTATPSYQIETTQSIKVGTYLGVNANPSTSARVYANQGADYTLGTNYAYYIAGSGYAGGIALDATSMQIGHNSGSRALTFHSGASWAKRMTIDGASGNVGIANTSPAHTLSVTGTMNISGNANVGNIGTAAVVATANISTTAKYVKTTSSGITGGAYGNITRYPTLTLTSNADIHLSSSTTGNSTTSQNYGITFSQGSVGTTGAIMFSENTTDGTGIGFYASNNYAAAPQLKLSIEPGGNMLPGANASQSLGSTTLRWSNIWGLSSSAQYADLAEMYRSDADYEPGTVLQIGGEHEITVCNSPRSDRVFGCVSTDPAYLMNDSERDGIWLPVVLTGRAPIRVKGQVRKGDRLVSAGDGAAMSTGTFGSSYQIEIGRALEDKTTEEMGLIEAYISTK